MDLKDLFPKGVPTVLLTQMDLDKEAGSPARALLRESSWFNVVAVVDRGLSNALVGSLYKEDPGFLVPTVRHAMRRSPDLAILALEPSRASLGQDLLLDALNSLESGMDLLSPWPPRLASIKDFQAMSERSGARILEMGPLDRSWEEMLQIQA